MLDQAVSALAGRGDDVGVVQIVEAWAAQGSPTAAARLHVGRAFHRLRMMDRATSRAREVLEQDPQNVEGLFLLARIYLDRGWPAKARVPLLTLRSTLGADHPEVAPLWIRAQAEPIRPDVNARQIERDGDPDKLLALAESFLATGSFLRGTGILERLRRTDPDNARVRALLWGVAGDTSVGDMTLAQVVRALVPVLPVPHHVGALPDEPEHTESYSDTTQNDRDLPEDDPELPDVVFPTLFKHNGPVATDEGDEPAEHTQASRLASAAQMQEAEPESDASDAPARAASLNGASHGDTQIMLVLRPGEEVKAAHKRREDEGGLHTSLNLREYQASMGMSGAINDPYGSDLEYTANEEKSELGLDQDEREDTGNADDLLEEEDENLVVMTRSADDQPTDDRPPAVFEQPIEVIEKHGTPILQQTAAPVEVEPPAPLDPEPPGPEPEPPPPASNRWIILGIAAFALAMMGAFVVIVWARLFDATSEASVRDGLVDTLASADYERLLAEESWLDAQTRAKASPATSAALAEARLVLWDDFNGDPGRMKFVEATLAEPQNLDTHRLAMLRAEHALAREDYVGAAAAVSREAPADDEERLLFARLAAHTGDTTHALEHFTHMERPDAPRYALARAEILAQSGKVPESVAVLDALQRTDPEHTLAAIARIQLGGGAPQARAVSAEMLLSHLRGESVAPRLEGKIHAIRAEAYTALNRDDKAREAANAGLARDGTNTDLLLLLAADESARGQLTEALNEVRTVVSTRPGEAEARTAAVLLLLDLDRVDEAEKEVADLRTNQLLPDRTPILEGLITVWGRGAPPAQPITAGQAETPLGGWLDALIAAQSHAPDAAARAQAAVERLTASPLLLERRLAGRASALALLMTPAADAPALAEKLVKRADLDAAAHVYLGRYYESLGKRAVAAQHFDRACELGPQLGLAWYEKGRFYEDARDSLGRSAEAFKKYLQLAPSGPRAERATKALRHP